jgi:hypothetical protein
MTRGTEILRFAHADITKAKPHAVAVDEGQDLVVGSLANAL